MLKKPSSAFTNNSSTPHVNKAKTIENTATIIVKR